MPEKQKILVLCTGNSARSQMAEGLLKNLVGDRYDVCSAGTEPGLVRPEAIKALAEIGIDISANRSKSVEEFTDRTIEYVFTVCDNAKENCPYFPAVTKLIHHAFPDPAAIEGTESERVAAFRDVRDQIKAFLPELLSEIDD